MDYINHLQMLTNDENCRDNNGTMASAIIIVNDNAKIHDSDFLKRYLASQPCHPIEQTMNNRRSFQQFDSLGSENYDYFDTESMLPMSHLTSINRSSSNESNGNKIGTKRSKGFSNNLSIQDQTLEEDDESNRVVSRKVQYQSRQERFQRWHSDGNKMSLSTNDIAPVKPERMESS